MHLIRNRQTAIPANISARPKFRISTKLPAHNITWTPMCQPRDVVVEADNKHNNLLALSQQRQQQKQQHHQQQAACSIRHVDSDDNSLRTSQHQHQQQQQLTSNSHRRASTTISNAAGYDDNNTLMNQTSLNLRASDQFLSRNVRRRLSLSHSPFTSAPSSDSPGHPVVGFNGQVTPSALTVEGESHPHTGPGQDYHALCSDIVHVYPSSSFINQS